ncbi:MAG: hypothetical protein H6839_09635 [Planctomycetes bacterium]|nr:hypothetical protein [Planctomycetota bacterium]
MPDSENLIRRQIAEQMQESFADALTGITWALLDNKARTPADDEKMLYAAFASAYHYLETAGHAEHQRAEWLISRVYSALGNGEEALRHARRCMELTEQHGDKLAEYDRAFALEALARANAVAGNADEAAKYRAEAEKAGNAIADAASRKVLLDQLQAR